MKRLNLKKSAMNKIVNRITIMLLALLTLTMTLHPVSGKTFSEGPLIVDVEPYDFSLAPGGEESVILDITNAGGKTLKIGVAWKLMDCPMRYRGYIENYEFELGPGQSKEVEVIVKATREIFKHCTDTAELSIYYGSNLSMISENYAETDTEDGTLGISLNIEQDKTIYYAMIIIPIAIIAIAIIAILIALRKRKKKQVADATYQIPNQNSTSGSKPD